MESAPEPRTSNADGRPSAWPLLAVVLAAGCGLGLMVDSLGRSAATYDEVAYLRIAARWWRTGDQAEISRMGSPLTFWKLQQAPVLAVLDRVGRADWVENPIQHQAQLLPWIRAGGLWVWLLAFGLTAAWARQLYGRRAMALAAWMFALSPNLLAHGPLATMEVPLVAGSTAMLFTFWQFLRTGHSGWFWGSAALGGLTVSLKFTAVLLPPIVALAWWLDRMRSGERSPLKLVLLIGGAMVGYAAVMVLVNLALTGFALLPLSERMASHPSFEGRVPPMIERFLRWLVETPIPQDWVGFATQMRHQRSGGPSYLLGETRQFGWWYYYLIALAVKVPLVFWPIALVRIRLAWRRRSEPPGRDLILPVAIFAFLVITALGSKRNYGLRYLLPLAPLAIVWVSALAERRERWARGACWLMLAGYATAVAGSHPHELTYFNAAAGGPIGGRRILSDSNLDWGQGARALARLQRERPEFRDVTVYYFGDTDPSHDIDPALYGVVGRVYRIDAGEVQAGLPLTMTADTTYLAVSASLQWGPWGPPGYFHRLEGVEPVAYVDDATIAIYRVADLPPH